MVKRSWFHHFCDHFRIFWGKFLGGGEKKIVKRSFTFYMFCWGYSVLLGLKTFIAHFNWELAPQPPPHPTPRDFFYIQSFSLTECIGIVGVRKYLGCLSAVRLSVRLCVRLSVRASMAKLPVRFQWNFPKMIPYRSIGVRLSFGSLT